LGTIAAWDLRPVGTAKRIPFSSVTLVPSIVSAGAK
jgi:hypothetical protein